LKMDAHVGRADNGIALVGNRDPLVHAAAGR
jgi:hypothetical protein